MVPAKATISAPSLYNFPDLEFAVLADPLKRTGPIATTKIVHPTTKDWIHLPDHIRQSDRTSVIQDLTNLLLDARCERLEFVEVCPHALWRLALQPCLLML